jgi:uncharacterized Zn finger protein
VTHLETAVVFEVQGDHDWYLVTFIEGRDPECSCPSSRLCSHIVAAVAWVGQKLEGEPGVDPAGVADGPAPAGSSALYEEGTS